VLDKCREAWTQFDVPSMHSAAILAAMATMAALELVSTVAASKPGAGMLMFRLTIAGAFAGVAANLMYNPIPAMEATGSVLASLGSVEGSSTGAAAVGYALLQQVSDAMDACGDASARLPLAAGLRGHFVGCGETAFSPFAEAIRTVLDAGIASPSFAAIAAAIAPVAAFGMMRFWRTVAGCALQAASIDRPDSLVLLGEESKKRLLALGNAIGPDTACAIVALNEYHWFDRWMSVVGIAIIAIRMAGAVSNGLVEAEAEGALFAIGVAALIVYAAGMSFAGFVPFDLSTTVPAQVVPWRSKNLRGESALAASYRRERASQGTWLILSILALLRLGFAWRHHAQEGVELTVFRSYGPAAILGLAGVGLAWFIPSNSTDAQSSRQTTPGKRPAAWVRVAAQSMQALATGIVLMYWKARQDQG